MTTIMNFIYNTLNKYFLLNNSFCLTGKASKYQILFQTSGSLNMEDLVSLHHYIMMYLIITFIFVLFMTIFCFYSFKLNNLYFINYNNLTFKSLKHENRFVNYETIKISHNSLLEFI
jgi:uncharacterized membrane protein YecN with MAPEG domain